MPDATLERCFWKMPKSATTTASFRAVQELGWKSWAKGHLPAWRMFDKGPTGVCQARLGVSPWEIPFHFGPVRSPWEWYPSLWRHTVGRKQFHPSRDAYATGPGFRGFLHGVTHIDPDRVEGISKDRHIVILDPEPGTTLPDGSVGLWAWCIEYFYRREGAWLLDALYPTDRIAEAWPELTGDTEPLVLRNTANGRLGPVEHRNGDPLDRFIRPGTTDYRSWYDDEMIDWVAKADAELIGFFGFEPFTRSPQAIYELPARRVA